MKTKQFIQHSLTAFALLCVPMAFTACSDSDALLADGTDLPEMLEIDGSCNVYELANSEQSGWQIVDCPEWITPVKQQGLATDKIEIYVESNSRTPLREGDITVRYQNGTTRSVTTRQSDETPSWSIHRSYAVGWSFDIRTYNDSRGLRQQIFNTQKMKNSNKNAYRIDDNTETNLQFFYGEDISRLQKDITGKLELDTDTTNYDTFSLSLKGNFGKNSFSNSKRIFSWIHSMYLEKVVSIFNFDETAAQKSGWFTTEFNAMRTEVINAGGSDAAISRLIEMYGTHVVISAYLGGSFDYYYSTVLNEKIDTTSIHGGIEFGYKKKFNLGIKGDATYENAYNNMSTETIEKFSVSGGDALTLARKVEEGTIDSLAVETWRDSFSDASKYELMNYSLIPISALFPPDISAKIGDYMSRMYYNNLPLTRSALKND